jgi:IS30 family transposase
MLKKYKQLTSEQKYAIYLGLQNGTSKTEIAKSTKVSPSTVYRDRPQQKQKRSLFMAFGAPDGPRTQRASAGQ